jgi:UDP-GlcNAc:undecaprenyl-phosphate/decaprenyl-phosphate GlcNAc-1-phosphate transferase
MTLWHLFAGGLVAGALATWLVRRAAWALGIVAAPNPIVPQHTRPVAYLGGTGIAAGAGAVLGVAALSGIPVSLLPPGDERALLLGAIGYLGLGTFDDLRPLRPGPKLAAQLGLAVAVVAIADTGLAVPTLAVAALWLVVVVNAVNLTDVCDGLVGSLAAAALVGVAAIAPAAAPLALLLAAACVGFLAFNRAPASIFLGDGGSHLLGFAIGGLWLAALHGAPSWHLAAAAPLGAGVFLFELVFLVIVRAQRGLPFWRGSPDHLALRLQAAGLGKHKTVAVGLVTAAVLSGTGQWLARVPGPLPLGLAIAEAAALAIAGRLLYAREPVPLRGRPREAEELAG